MLGALCDECLVWWSAYRRRNSCDTPDQRKKGRRGSKKRDRESCLLVLETGSGLSIFTLEQVYDLYSVVVGLAPTYIQYL